MFRRISYTVAALAAISFSLVSCLSENSWRTEPSVVPEGYVSVSFRTDIPAMQEVVTRAVDPDGAGVQNMTLFCFDSYGLFISTATASLAPASQTSGTFTAEIPENTSIIHFVANQNMSNFAEDDFRGKSESEVMALLEGSSGRMIYWSRFEISGEGDIVSQLKGADPVRLIRNHAMFSVSVASDVGFSVTGFAVCNTNAFGTVAPYHPDYGFPTDGSGFVWPGNEDFVTLPVNGAKLSDVVDVTDAENQYVFETENRADDPVSVIIKGSDSGSDLYYRVLLITEDGSQIMVRRNHHYIINIVGELANGQPSFEAALAGPATNNVWISISEDVNEVQNGEWALAVNETSFVIDEAYAEAHDYRFTAASYTLTKRNSPSIMESEAAEVSITDSDGLDMNHRETYSAEGNVLTGNIVFDLNRLADDEQTHEYDILVRKGKLQRTIKVILVRTQQFVPAWVSTQVYGEVDGKDSRANVTAMFTIPETCPAELFPMNVYISTENLDARSEAGNLTVVIEGSEDWYGEDTGTGYKYVYPVSGPGSYSVYFENILNQEQDASGTMTFEAECFETMQKTYTFARHERTITIDGHNSSVDNGDELITVTVPQKRGAAVQFDMVMMNLGGSWPSFDPEPENVGENDEFLLYSQNLDYYEVGEESLAGVNEFDCTFYPIDEEVWQTATGGRMMMFMPRRPQNPAAGTGRYSIYMKTNKARSAETVRIASNQKGSPAVLDRNNGTDGLYRGNSYRSVILEIDNYDPFRFGATVAGQNAGNEVSLTYVPYQPVDIEFDVTAFTADGGTQVDPFGEEFEIYIDAPMLEIDGSRLAQYGLDSDKLMEDPATPGRFVYTVEATREAESAYGTGERKTLPFRTASSVSSGDITISSNQEKVVFDTETFSVANAPISGTIQYRAEDGLHYVPANGFVSFERTRNNSRIGSLTIVDKDGDYELRLRKEYEFNWYSDEVELRYEDDGGNVYTATYPNLNTLNGSPDIVLERQTVSGN